MSIPSDLLKLKLIQMKKWLIILVLVAIFGCNKEDDPVDDSIIVLTGQFQKILYDENIWNEYVGGELIMVNRSIQFVPDIEGISTEDMYSKMDADGKFTVKLKKGVTYWNSLFYAGIPGGSAEGHIIFSEAEGNFITIPANAPDNFDLGLIQIARWFPYGAFAINEYVPGEAFAWLPDAITVNSAVPPVISGISKEETELYDEDNNYMGSILEFTPNISSSLYTYCTWFLEDTDGRASFSQNYQNVIKKSGTKVSVYTDSFGGHGTLKLIVTDSYAGSATLSITF